VPKDLRDQQTQLQVLATTENPGTILDIGPSASSADPLEAVDASGQAAADGFKIPTAIEAGAPSEADPGEGGRAGI
jgi:hypothetical protein